MKILTALVFLIITASSWSSVNISSTVNETTYIFSVDKVNISRTQLENRDFSSITLDGVDLYTAVHYDKDHPEIPVIRFYVYANSEKDIQVYLPSEKSIQDQVFSLPYKIKPSQESRPKNKTQDVSFLSYGPDKNEDFWPSFQYSITFGGSIRNRSRWLVTLYPIRYNASTLEYKLTKDFEVKVLNPNFQSPETKKQETMVFVVGKKFKKEEAIARYAVFKREQGLAIKTIVFGEDVVDDISLRKAIQNIYNTPGVDLKYVFIIGDVEDVSSHKGEKITDGVTDHFYRAIDTDDYITDINGPDIGVGRITPKNIDELTSIINKFIDYQTGIFINEEWLKHPAFLATNDESYITQSTHDYVISKYTAPLGLTGIFPKNPQLGGDKLYAAKYRADNENVITSLSEGRFLINYSGHGSTKTWDGPEFTQTDVRNLNQTGAYPFVVGNACFTGDFTVPESFAETWIKNSAIMYWGSMDRSFWDEDSILEKAMADNIFQFGMREFGEVTNKALSQVWRYYNGKNNSSYYWETYVTLGDPSIHLRTNPTFRMMMEGETKIPYGQDTLHLKFTKEDGTPVASAQVALSLGEQIVSVAKTNKNGVVNLSVANINPGTNLTLTAYADDAQLLKTDIHIFSKTNPSLFLANITANNTTTSKLRPFETVKINFLVKNLAHVSTKGGKITLESIEGPAKILSAEALIPSLQSNETYHFEGDGLKLKVLDASLSDKITLKFRWTTIEGDTNTFTQTYLISRADLLITLVDFGNPSEPDIGGPGPNKEGIFYVTVKNRGNDKIINAKLRPFAKKCIAHVAGDLHISELNPGETIRLTTAITVKNNSDCKNDSSALFFLNGTYEGPEAIALYSDGEFPVAPYRSFNYKLPPQPLKISYQKKVVLSFEVKDISQLTEINLNIKITYKYVVDLIITLVSPTGSEVILMKKNRSPIENLDLTLYKFNENFKPLYGKNANGLWKLIIQDTAVEDNGTLDDVNIKLKGLN